MQVGRLDSVFIIVFGLVSDQKKTVASPYFLSSMGLHLACLEMRLKDTGRAGLWGLHPYYPTSAASGRGRQTAGILSPAAPSEYGGKMLWAWTTDRAASPSERSCRKLVKNTSSEGQAMPATIQKSLVYTPRSKTRMRRSRRWAGSRRKRYTRCSLA